jgi:hypothetical protein
MKLSEDFKSPRSTETMCFQDLLYNNSLYILGVTWFRQNYFHIKQRLYISIIAADINPHVNDATEHHSNVLIMELGCFNQIYASIVSEVVL